MKFPFICLNGDTIPVDRAVLPIESVEAIYGFGVYESVKVRNEIVFFLHQHVQRLFHSASCIALIHSFSHKQIERYVLEFVKTLNTDSCNLKLLLYGSPEEPQFFIIPSAPHYPDRKWYRDGVSLISAVHERWMPQAKTLNMLPSYVLYKKAQAQHCYDSLLIDKKGMIREGTRTNVYVIKGNRIFSPPKKDILEGVTMMTIEKVLQNTDYDITYKEIPFTTIFEYDGMFISSTSSKILPVRRVDTKGFTSISKDLLHLINLYEKALDRCKGDFMKL